MQETLFLKGAEGLRADLQLYLLAVDNDCLLLKIRFPYLFGMALRKANVVAVLLAFTGDVAFTHDLNSSFYIQWSILTIFTL